MRFSRLIVIHFCLAATQVSAFQSISVSCRRASLSLHRHDGLASIEIARTGPSLPMASTSSDSTDTANGSVFSSEELQFLENTFADAVKDAQALKSTLLEQLPTMNPAIIMKLKQSLADPNETVQAVANALGSVLEAQLEQARDILKSLLDAGEIRKMDALIGKAARDGKLDAAFFSVLQMNLQNAAQEAAAAAEEGEASRVQVLQHVYTRCQEEVEKNVPPGIALLNKLLRTEIDSIRANQLKHYLCPQPNVITAPDGTEIQLEGEPRILVPPPLLVDAIGNAIKQIRTVEKAGGTDPASAANMVESVRQVAKEARIIIGENYGIESEALQEFEEGLQPVFRPDSPESVYIKGE
ncbi:expressed unknown protein [Seminavis robusta]|uniref:Secreted protein n=1 Tax=Seminavis robusta TaxID=568900 RepID=A0A9N8DRH7_9STRA|nr:expressed unknown protein [Seminavis robusta]|eukprot:Sro318_g116070.1 n/a (355) ;mRNA; f:73194-74258